MFSATMSSVILIFSMIIGCDTFVPRNPETAVVYTDTPTDIPRLRYDPYEQTWDNYKREYGKTYASEREEEMRRGIFMSNVKYIQSHNWKYVTGRSTFYMDVNQFSDMTANEVNSLVKGFAGAGKPGFCKNFEPSANQSLPDFMDWRQHGYVTPVKDQGDCGSCWAFSTTGSIEGQHFRATGQLVSLSEQQLVDCSGSYDPDDQKGCGGGFIDNAFGYVIIAGGIESESGYPYVAKNNSCTFDKTKVRATIRDCRQIIPFNETNLKWAVGSQGPVSVTMDASHTSFHHYKGGIYQSDTCSPDWADHALLAVGYGTENGVDYWLIKNSWGTKWGIDGYVKLLRGKGMCAIAHVASFPVV